MQLHVLNIPAAESVVQGNRSCTEYPSHRIAKTHGVYITRKDFCDKKQIDLTCQHMGTQGNDHGDLGLTRSPQGAGENLIEAADNGNGSAHPNKQHTVVDCLVVRDEQASQI